LQCSVHDLVGSVEAYLTCNGESIGSSGENLAMEKMMCCALFRRGCLKHLGNTLNVEWFGTSFSLRKLQFGCTSCLDPLVKWGGRANHSDHSTSEVMRNSLLQLQLLRSILISKEFTSSLTTRNHFSPTTVFPPLLWRGMNPGSILGHIPTTTSRKTFRNSLRCTPLD